MAWSYYGAELMRADSRPRRPWAWWRFEAGEDQPPTREAEVKRLAELGEAASPSSTAALGGCAA